MNPVRALENKDYAKFLGVLIDKHLNWKQDIDYIASNIIASLRHHVPLNTLRFFKFIDHSYFHICITV